MKKSLLTLGVALVTTHTAIAKEQPSVEAFLGLNGTNWDNEYIREVEKDLGVDLGLGFNLSEEWALEGWYGRSDAENKAGTKEILVETASINALRYLGENQKTRPFLSIGASREMFNPDRGRSLSDNTLDLGIGVKHYYENNLILRGDLIARAFDDEQNDLTFDKVARISIGYAFGGSSASSSKPKPAPVTAESSPEPQTLVDSDNDGVYDNADSCPNTPVLLKVDENGCKIILSETVSIDLNIQFPNNSDEISDGYLNEIDRVAKFMQQYEGTEVEVRGYTDDRGAASYNQQLSEKRAKAVAAKLVENFSVDSDRVSAVGFGETNPIADNETAEGRSQNRRVVAEISTKVEKAITK